MRTWTRAPFLTYCSFNHCEIYPDQPMQILKLDGMKNEFQYCLQHAQGIPPPDLPPLAVDPVTGRRIVQQRTKAMVPLNKLKMPNLQAALSGRDRQVKD